MIYQNVNLYIFSVVLIFLFISEFKYEPKEGLDLIGKKAPEFRGLTWINTSPIYIDDLKGKVVLIRFWLVGCPFCINSAPSLVEFYNKYKDKGLVIIGIHHPKSEETMSDELVKETASVLGFNFPIAQDLNWLTIESYWVGEKKRSYTSSSILIDKSGIIRFVHDGGEYFRSDTDLQANAAFEALEHNIIMLLNE